MNELDVEKYDEFLAYMRDISERVSELTHLIRDLVERCPW